MTTRDESKLYDVRTLERRLRRGIISKKDYEKYLKSLPDASDKMAPVHAEPARRDEEADADAEG
jgi:hypothetical protein